MRKRYFTGKAVREATQEESQYDMVEFIEGEEALEQHAAAREEELQSLKYQNMKLADIIRKLGGDPTKDPEEQQAEVIPPVGSGLGDEAKF
jgi:NADH dehydrogenase/NADH:ubiquinone oxidoreductase subunit G